MCHRSLELVMTVITLRNNDYALMIVGVCGQVDIARALDSRSKGLGFDSQ